MNRDFTLKCIMAQEEGFYRFTFCCELCEKGFTTGRLSASSVGQARKIAIQEARPHFNRCHKCGNWVCDEHYNEDVMMCTKCAPRSN